MSRNDARALTLLTTLALAPAAGCDAPYEEDSLESRTGVADPVAGQFPPPSTTFNTGSLNGAPLMRMLLPVELLPPGGVPPEQTAVDVSLSLIELEVAPGQYVTVDSVSASAGQLILVVGQQTYSGLELLGARMWYSQSEFISIADYSAGGGVFGYDFEYGSVGNAKQHICAPDADGERWAYVVDGVSVDVTDGSVSNTPGSLMIACTTGAVGKAITWGFAPWTLADPSEGRDLYQAGIRTVRADYCGSGVSYTEDGELIQVSNAVSGLAFGSPEEQTEAVFGKDGALCLSSPRVMDPGDECSIPVCGDEASLMTQSDRTWTKLAPTGPAR